jgi:hypothetical protein
MSVGIGSMAAKWRTDAPHYTLALIFIAFVFGIPIGMGSAPNIFRDGDVSWHIAAGRWILEHQAIPRTDPFSFTAFGQPWIDTEWLAEIVYASAFNLFGYAGLAVIVVAGLIALNAIIFFYLQSRVSPVVIAVAFPAIDLVLSRFALARPHVLAWPLLAAWTIVLLKSDESGRPPKLWWVFLLTIWTNLHASFPLALPVAAAIGLDGCIKNQWKHVREWISFGLTSVIAMSLNANGIAGVLQPFNISSLSILPFIDEWHASSITNSRIFYLLLVCGIGGLIWGRVRFPIGRLLLLLVMLIFAFAHIRHQSSFVILAICIIPTLWPSKPLETKVPYWALAAVVPFLITLALAPLRPPATGANPWRMISAIPSKLKSQPVLNEYTFGGPLILSGIRVYIDGRAEMYGDRFVTDYMNISGGDLRALDRAVQRYGIKWVMLSRGNARLLDAVARSGKWRPIYSDNVGVIAVMIPEHFQPVTSQPNSVRTSLHRKQSNASQPSGG